MRRAQKGIRRAAREHAARACGVNHLLRFDAIHAEGFFRIGVLPRLDGSERNGNVRLRDGEVEDDLDCIVADQLIHLEHARNVVFLRLLLRSVGVEVGAGDDVEDGEVFGVLEVGAADGAATNDADSNSFGHGVILCWVNG